MIFRYPPIAVLSFFLSLFLSLFLTGSALAARLNYGKYFGSIRMDRSPRELAVSLDAFVTQEGDPTVFPELNIILRVNLGGYFSSEYITYSFYDPTYDFEKGTLQLDDPRNDLSATLQVKNEASGTILEGPVTYRPTNAQGRIRVVLNAVGPPSVANTVGAGPLLPVLSGEYEGHCASVPASLELETGRGLARETRDNALTGYKITGRLGFSDPEVCGDGGIGIPTGRYCNLYPFSDGLDFLYDHHLLLFGPLATLDCDQEGDQLSCILEGVGKPGKCLLSKRPSAATPPAQIPPSVLLRVPSDQMKPLPDPNPPLNSGLTEALNGDFYGYLHFESLDRYQLISMNVIATTSAENPHVQNQVYIAPSVSRYLGSSWRSDSAFSTRFAQRVFYLNPGFALTAPGNNDLLVITSWMQGYLSGVWYSRSYGRVGTFELRKGARPPVPRGMPLVRDFSGEFEGPLDGPVWAHNLWWLEFTVPGQIAQPGQSVQRVIGQYRLRGEQSPVRSFDQASFDFNSGALRFLIRDPKGDRIVSGRAETDDPIELQWPVGPGMGAPLEAYRLLKYQRIPARNPESGP